MNKCLVGIVSKCLSYYRRDIWTETWITEKDKESYKGITFQEKEKKYKDNKAGMSLTSSRISKKPSVTETGEQFEIKSEENWEHLYQKEICEPKISATLTILNVPEITVLKK